MVERLVTALTTLGAVGIRCKRGTLNDKAILPDSPVTVAYPYREDGKEIVVAVEIYGAHAVECENTTYQALAALKTDGWDCTSQKCVYNGKTGLFSALILASWEKTPKAKVYLDGLRVSNVKRFQVTGGVTEVAADGGNRGVWKWELTLEQRLAATAAPAVHWDGNHTLKVVTDGGTEIYADCSVSAVHMEMDDRGMVLRRTLESTSRTVQ